MTRESSHRPYRMRLRAEQQALTRQRITESAVELHGTLGPARTSMSAVAAHAGVRRSTLYRHFPDESALFDACTAHWMAVNPPPDLSTWAEISSPDERLRTALGELHGFYRRTEQMLDNLFRDESIVPLVADRFAAFRGYLAAAQDALMRGRNARGTTARRARGALGHAVAFSTWKSLVREHGVSDADAVVLLCALVAASSTTAGSTWRTTA
jgi:AcrR family transcriptional regulator